MGWGAIPDDHPLMAGMVGLQTSHRYGNATFLASDFVLGIGNRWANRHTGSIEVYTKGRKFVHVDIEPTQIGRVFGPDLGIVSDARAALDAVHRGRRAKARRRGRLKDRGAGRRDCRQRKTHHAAQDPFRQRADQAAARLRGDERGLRPATSATSRTIGLSQIARRAVPARLQAAQLDQLRPGRPAGLDDAGRARRARGRSRRRRSSRCPATTTSSS